MPQLPLTIEREVLKRLRLDYLCYLPEEHGQDPNKKWPLILFLHGAGERGSSLELIKAHGIPRIAEERKLPFVAISPQCPVNTWWSDYLPLLDDLILNAMDTLAVDPRRVYLTGLSMGGFGTWHMAVEYPQRFAAIAPICGGGPWMYNVRERLGAIKHVPTRVFHGAKDEVVPLSYSQVMVDALQALGGDVSLTVYPETGHDSWTETYNNPDLYDWFLSHQRED